MGRLRVSPLVKLHGHYISLSSALCSGSHGAKYPELCGPYCLEQSKLNLSIFPGSLGSLTFFLYLVVFESNTSMSSLN